MSMTANVAILVGSENECFSVCSFKKDFKLDFKSFIICKTVNNSRTKFYYD